MAVDNIPTFSVYQNAISGFNTLQTALSKVQTQVSTGNIAQNFSDLDGSLSQSLSAETLVASSNSYTTGNNFVITNVQAYASVLQQLQSIDTQLQSALATQRSAAGPTNPLTQTATSLLQTVQGLLNTQSSSGQYIFSGSRTQTPPVYGITTTTNLVNNIPTANYYQGDNATLSLEASAGVTVQYGIKANDPTFQNLIGALNMAIEGANNGSDTTLASAVNLANQAGNQLSSMVAANGDTLTQLQNANDNNASDVTYLQQVLGNLDDTNIPAASVQVSEDQTTLQASYQIFADESKDSLVNFLTSIGA